MKPEGSVRALQTPLRADPRQNMGICTDKASEVKGRGYEVRPVRWFSPGLATYQLQDF